VPQPADDAAPAERWRCATCRWEGAAFACPACGATATAPLAAGAGRLATELARSHPTAEVVRMEGFDAPGPQRRPAIAVLTRGSVVERPAWLAGGEAAVVVVPDADALLGRPSLGAAEDALRLWFAVARWTRHLLLQTREPTNPAVQALVRWDPEGFWRRESERRSELAWPPHSSLVALSAPPEEAQQVAAAVRGALPPADEVLGPDPDGGVLVKSATLRGTLDALTPLRHDWGKRSVRVRVDVDPVT
jgi:primosomal protein N' (replication factor Y)